jgi:glycosyltransferase involved in cell wall biosynthesis
LRAFASGRRRRFRKAYNIPPKTFVLGHLGRLAPEKNLEYLGRAVVRFLKRNKDARFLVVGDGPSAKGLRALFRKEKLAERLVMPGTKSGRDLHDAYAAMDVFAFSSFSETQGMVLAEAMAAGLPAVALDASGVREVVRDGRNGYLLDAAADERVFANQLQKIAQDGRLWQRLSAGAGLTARQFSESVSTRKALGLYQKVLRRTRRQRAQTEQDALGTLLKRIEVEWSLIVQKAGAVYEAVAGNKHPAKPA